ncbi:MAG: O-succinylbenzoate-CoA ligase [Microbacteriaceae bacterium]|jgi:O-succinylbenzoic acid--CoA ligase|nr:O-succinylbenzoate-CoA ligase [Microbacteriaceae bacterium]
MLAALRAALTADGPAVFPRPGAAVTATAAPPRHVHKRIAVVIETSGSSGEPKRVALSADALLASAAASETALGGPGRWLLALPVHYIAGVNVLVRSIAAQTEPVLLPSARFDPEAFFAAAATMGADSRRFTALVPAQLARLVDDAGDRAVAKVLRTFDRILVGGQATPPRLLERCEEIGLRVTRTYGSSETGGGCVYDGAPIGAARVRIVDGQIELSGPMLAEEYLGDPARTAEAFVIVDGHRWYRTGDVGEIVDGLLRVSGRLDRVIISGGIKVSLDAVERVVRGMPGLADAVAIPAASATWGQVPVIVSTAPVDLAALRSVVVSSLGRAAAPREVLVVADIPLLPSGKADRAALRTLVAGEGAADN